MAISNKTILSDIETFGIDQVIDSIDIDRVDDGIIKIILRTIKESKLILVATLEESIADQETTPQESQTL